MDDQLFAKLQRYAKSGRIIATLGDINNLSFLKESKIAVVDISNIHSYCMIDLDINTPPQPRIIWTCPGMGPLFRYFSYLHNKLADIEREEFRDLLQKVDNAQNGNFVPEVFLRELGDTFDKPSDEYNYVVRVNFSLEMLRALRKYCQWVYLLPNGQWIDMNIQDDVYNLLKIHRLTVEQFDGMVRDQQLLRLAPMFFDKFNHIFANSFRGDAASRFKYDALFMAFIMNDAGKLFSEKLNNFDPELLVYFFEILQKNERLNQFVITLGPKMQTIMSYLKDKLSVSNPPLFQTCQLMIEQAAASK